MKIRFKVVIILVSFIVLMASCSENNVLSPAIKDQIVEREVLTYVDYTSFSDIIGSWMDIDWGGIWIISSNSYYDNGGGWYELYGEIVEKELTKNYFIIRITNHSTDPDQEGKYTKVHIKEYQSFSVSRSEVKMAQHCPQSDTISGARSQSVNDVSFWSSWTNF